MLTRNMPKRNSSIGLLVTDAQMDNTLSDSIARVHCDDGSVVYIHRTQKVTVLDVLNMVLTKRKIEFSNTGFMSFRNITVDHLAMYMIPTSGAHIMLPHDHNLQRIDGSLQIIGFLARIKELAVEEAMQQYRAMAERCVSYGEIVQLIKGGNNARDLNERTVVVPATTQVIPQSPKQSVLPSTPAMSAQLVNITTSGTTKSKTQLKKEAKAAKSVANPSTTKAITGVTESSEIPIASPNLTPGTKSKRQLKKESKAAAAAAAAASVSSVPAPTAASMPVPTAVSATSSTKPTAPTGSSKMGGKSKLAELVTVNSANKKVSSRPSVPAPPSSESSDSDAAVPPRWTTRLGNDDDSSSVDSDTPAEKARKAIATAVPPASSKTAEKRKASNATSTVIKVNASAVVSKDPTTVAAKQVRAIKPVPETRPANPFSSDSNESDSNKNSQQAAKRLKTNSPSQSATLMKTSISSEPKQIPLPNSSSKSTTEPVPVTAPPTAPVSTSTASSVDAPTQVTIPLSAPKSSSKVIPVPPIASDPVGAVLVKAPSDTPVPTSQAKRDRSSSSSSSSNSDSSDDRANKRRKSGGGNPLATLIPGASALIHRPVSSLPNPALAAAAAGAAVAAAHANNKSSKNAIKSNKDVHLNTRSPGAPVAVVVPSPVSVAGISTVVPSFDSFAPEGLQLSPPKLQRSGGSNGSNNSGRPASEVHLSQSPQKSGQALSELDRQIAALSAQKAALQAQSASDRESDPDATQSQPFPFSQETQAESASPQSEVRPAARGQRAAAAAARASMSTQSVADVGGSTRRKGQSRVKAP